MVETVEVTEAEVMEVEMEVEVMEEDLVEVVMVAD